MKSKKEIIQSVEYIFENTKRIHGNSEAIDWQKVAIHKSVEYILSLPLDIPTDEEIETESNKITYRNIPTFDTQRVAFRIAAKWVIEQIIERNQK